MSAVIVKNNLDSELKINHTDGEGAVTLESELLKQGSVGVGQSWVDVIGSRSAGVTYTNTTGKPIFVSATGNSTVVGNFGILLNIDGINVSLQQNYYDSFDNTVCGIVPNGSTYSVSIAGGDLVKWSELR